jgi:hypothetical protein
VLSPAVRGFRARSTAVFERVRPYWLEPWTLLAALAVLQWALVLRLALTAEHNGWLYYQGGDETFLYSSAWVVGHGHLPDAAVGFLWPILTSPVAALAGPNFLSGLPILIILQTVVLLPLGLLAIYGCGSRIGGRVIGSLAAAIWVLAPHLTTNLFVSAYHEKWVSLTLPQALGLSGMGDFPSMVLLACAAYFVLRLLDTGATVDAAIAALLAGLAIGLKPANVLILAGVFPALVVARRWRGAAVFGAFLVPAVVTLAVWKLRGLGHLPLLAAAPALPVAAGTALRPLPMASFNSYLNLDWHAYGQTLVDLREVFWSRRLLEFLPLAGLIAVARSSFAKAMFLGGWFGAFILVKIPRASVDDASIWRLLTPSWPALLLLISALPLLLPGVGAGLAKVPRPSNARFLGRGLALGLCVVTVLPLLVVLLLTPVKGAMAARLEVEDLYVTRDSSIKLAAAEQNGAVTLKWTGGGTRRADVFFRVLRTRPSVDVPKGIPPFPKARNGLLCEKSGPSRCIVYMDVIGTTKGRTYVDRPGPGRWVYRIEVAGNWLDDPTRGDPFVFSKDVTIKPSG